MAGCKCKWSNFTWCCLSGAQHKTLSQWVYADPKRKFCSWFKNAIKIAIAIGDDADKDVLTQFTGTNEAVFTVHNIDALKQIIRVVAVTSSQIGSKSSTAGDTTKQEQVIKDVTEATKDIDGAQAEAAPANYTDNYDDWD